MKIKIVSNEKSRKTLHANKSNPLRKSNVNKIPKFIERIFFYWLKKRQLFAMDRDLNQYAVLVKNIFFIHIE